MNIQQWIASEYDGMSGYEMAVVVGLGTGKEETQTERNAARMRLSRLASSALEVVLMSIDIPPDVRVRHLAEQAEWHPVEARAKLALCRTDKPHRSLMCHRFGVSDAAMLRWADGVMA